MIEDDKKIKRGPPKHNPASYQVLQDIVIPAGTMLRAEPDGKFACLIGIGLATVHGKFVVDTKEANGDISAVLKKVIAL